MSNRQIVKQDYKLVNAKYDLNLNEMKIILNAISEINADDKDFYKYKIKLKDISQELHNQSLARSYTRIKNFCEDLLKKPLSIPREHGGFLVVNWFASLEYLPGVAEIEYDIHPKLKPYLLELKERFVKYNLKYILPLKSTYSIRIYQLLKEYEKLQKRTFVVEELMNILQTPKSYLYADFKRKILQVAERELKEHCDIYFSFEEIKEGKKVSEILFKILPNQKEQKEQKEQKNEQEQKEYLKSRRLFIAYMRKNFVNADVLEAQDRKTKQICMISIDPKGKIYDKRGTDFTSSRSDEIWNVLYQMAKDGTLLCLEGAQVQTKL